MASATASEAQMRLEIARLTASINHRKSEQAAKPFSTTYYQPRPSNTYVNPNYKPPSRQFTFKQPVPASSSSAVKDVVLGGVTFESSSRSLVRKDLPKPKPSAPAKKPTEFTRHSGHLVAENRVYKPTASTRGRGSRRGRPTGRNMTLTNNKRPYQNKKLAKRTKYMDKPCPRFTTTGSCNRGLTCMYQHDPSKIAICWPFLQGTCSKTAETCELSHDPTPQRTPLCHHFLNKGRCTRSNCPFPHVNVGARQGICRDFAVLGFCDKGLDCDKQHVRECPDFAENGTCTTKGCKLPHVIRANRNRKPEEAAKSSTTSVAPSSPVAVANEDLTLQRTAADAQLGDEFISLTFNESESEAEQDDDDDDDSEDEEDEDVDVDEPIEED